MKWKQIRSNALRGDVPLAILVKYKKEITGTGDKKSYKNIIVPKDSDDYKFQQTIALLGFWEDARTETLQMLKKYVDNLYVEVGDIKEIKSKFYNNIRNLEDEKLFDVYVDNGIEIEGLKINKQRPEKETDRFYRMVMTLEDNNYI